MKIRLSCLKKYDCLNWSFGSSRQRQPHKQTKLLPAFHRAEALSASPFRVYCSHRATKGGAYVFRSLVCFARTCVAVLLFRISSFTIFLTVESFSTLLHTIISNVLSDLFLLELLTCLYIRFCLTSSPLLLFPKMHLYSPRLGSYEYQVRLQQHKLRSSLRSLTPAPQNILKFLWLCIPNNFLRFFKFS